MQVVVRRVDLIHGDAVLHEDLREAFVELVRPSGLDRQSAALFLEPHAQDIRECNEELGQAARLRAADVDGVGVLVDQVSNLVNIAFREDLPVMDEQDAAGHRLDLVQYVARHHDATPFPPPFAHEPDCLVPGHGIHSSQGLVQD